MLLLHTRNEWQSANNNRKKALLHAIRSNAFVGCAGVSKGGEATFWHTTLRSKV